MSAVIAPCPFCGGTDTDVWSYARHGRATVAWAVVCSTPHVLGGPCMAHGPVMPSRLRAVDLWNERANGRASKSDLDTMLSNLATREDFDRMGLRLAFWIAGVGVFFLICIAMAAAA